MPKLHKTLEGKHVTISRQYHTRNDGHTEIIEMILHLTKEGKRTKDIVDMGMIALYEKLTNGESISTELSAGRITTQIAQMLDDMQSIQMQLVEIMANGIASGQIDPQAMASLASSMTEAKDKLDILEGVGQYAGTIVFSDDDD